MEKYKNIKFMKKDKIYINFYGNIILNNNKDLLIKYIIIGIFIFKFK